MSSVNQTKMAPLKWITGNVILSLLLSLFFITGSLAERSYGPVMKNDYLTKIVRKSYPSSSLTNNQIMVAILRANPKAFRGGNIHLLKLAVILKLPDEKDISQITKKEATGVISQHLIYANKGQTGNFSNPPLVISDTSQSNDLPPSDNSLNISTQKSDTSEEVPSKIKIEIRKEQHEKENKYKHVTALEKINDQQNKMLRSLDEQIELLEAQFMLNKTRAEQKKSNTSKTQEVNEDSPSDINSIKSANELNLKENSPEEISTVDTIENKVKEALEDTATNNKESPNDEEEIQVEAAIEVNPTNDIDNNTPTETLNLKETSIEERPSNDKVIEAKESGKPSSFDPEKNTPNLSIDDKAKLFVEDESDKRQTSIKPKEQSNEENNISKPIENRTTDSPFSVLESFNKILLYTILGLLGLGLFTLGYFLSGRTNNEKVPNTKATSYNKTKFVETPGKPFSIPDQESLKNPILKTKPAEIEYKNIESSSIENIIHANIESIGNSKLAQQEAELKINMARAYMDIGYIDAAKEVLEEVLEEGSKEQREAVQQMLSML